MKLWLDDKREKPEHYDMSVKTVGRAKHYLKYDVEHPNNPHRITHVGFDHDLGENVPTGYDLAVYIEQLAYEGKLQPISWSIQSDNSVVIVRIRQAMESADRFWKKDGYEVIGEVK